MTRRRPSEISRDWRGEIAGQIGWAPGITVMRFSSDRFRVRGMERGEKWFSETEDGGQVIDVEIARFLGLESFSTWCVIEGVFVNECFPFWIEVDGKTCAYDV